jgi:hypothetical protein
VIIKLSDRIPHIDDKKISVRELTKNPNTIITFDANFDANTGTFVVHLVLADSEDKDDYGFKIELDTVVRPQLISDRFLVTLSSLAEGLVSIESLIIQGLCETATEVSFSRLRYSKVVSILIKSLDQDFGATVTLEQLGKYFSYSD